MSDCPSEIHKTPVSGTLHGVFRNRHNPAHDGPVTYCAQCALWGEAFGFFIPSVKDPEGRDLVQAIHDRKNGT